jgi:hypothetical protein
LGLKSAKDGDYLKRMEDLFGYKGYKMQLYILAANNFGVLQTVSVLSYLDIEKIF